MAELIDREALIAEYDRVHIGKPGRARKLMEEAPTVDAVPVVRNDYYDGLKQKYVVLKAKTGELVENCFVLRPDKDPAAVSALRAYARSTENKTLAEDIINWVGEKGEE